MVSEMSSRGHSDWRGTRGVLRACLRGEPPRERGHSWEAGSVRKFKNQVCSSNYIHIRSSTYVTQVAALLLLFFCCLGRWALFLLLLDRVFQVNKIVSNPLHSSLKRYNDEMKPWKNLRLESGRSVENLPITFTSMFNHTLVSAFQWQVKIETRQSKSVNLWMNEMEPPPPLPQVGTM